MMERWRILHKERDFTVIDNGILRDPDLSLSERGFLCTVMALPDGWKFSPSGMADILSESLNTVKAVINRLVSHGYCKKGRIFDPKTGRISGYEYTFYEVKNGLGCVSVPQTNFPTVESPAVDFPAVEICHQLNTIENKVHSKSNTENISPSPSFDFLKSLKALGVSDQLARDWMAVRKTKRATNTKTAFDRIKAEFDKSGHPAEDCVRLAVENSWSGFKAEWMAREEPGESIEDINETLRRLNDGTYTR